MCEQKLDFIQENPKGRPGKTFQQMNLSIIVVFIGVFFSSDFMKGLGRNVFGLDEGYTNSLKNNC